MSDFKKQKRHLGFIHLCRHGKTMEQAKRVLVVDGSVQRCIELSDVLANGGFDVAVADSSLRAFKILAENEVDFAVLDIREENVANWFLYEELRARYPKLQIVFMNDLMAMLEADLDLDRKLDYTPSAMFAAPGKFKQ